MSARHQGLLQLAVFALISIGLSVCTCAAAPFSQLVVFGDSLSDVGNIAAATFDLYPGPYYYNDRISNGPVWVESMSARLGLGPTVRSTAGGSNFAYGGAQTSGTGGLNGLVIRDIDEQVDQFLATRTVDPSALFVVYAGANDLVNGQTNVSIPINNLADDIGRLVAAGTRNLLVPNLPLLGHTPRFNSNSVTLETYSTRSAQFNAALDTMLDTLQTSHPALMIFRLDVEALFDDALSNPANYGLTNVTDAAAPGLEIGDSTYNVAQIAPNADEYLFWDSLHPTATVHAHLAQRALELFVTPGDFNHDGAVDAADYVVWRNELGSQYTATDYDVWRANFGRALPAGVDINRTGSTPPIVGREHIYTSSAPEPSSAWLVIIGYIVVVPVDRRHAARC